MLKKWRRVEARVGEGRVGNNRRGSLVKRRVLFIMRVGLIYLFIKRVKIYDKKFDKTNQTYLFMCFFSCDCVHVTVLVS